MSHVLEMEPLGIRVEFLATAEDTGGELLEMEVSGIRAAFSRSVTSTVRRPSASRP